jgi:regulator of RNase E activity RraA/predicted MFS family arabinose efflux permease
VIPEQGVDPATVNRSSVSRGVVIAVAAVVPVFLVSALAVQIRQDLLFGTAALGGIVAAYFVTSAFGSILMGQVVERLGADRGTAVAASLSGSALALAALSRSWTQLAVALALAGIANALAQPAANMLLSVSMPVRRLGLAFGVKQSCVPAAALLGGLAVPTLGLVLGWRWAFGLSSAVTTSYAVWLWVRHSERGIARRTRTGTLRDSEAPLSSLLFLTVGGFLGAAAATSLGAFLVDSSVAIGFNPSTAGWLYALLSLGTIASRVGLGWALDRAPSRSRFAVMALLLGGGSAGYVLLAGENPALFVLGATLGFVVGWGWTGVFHYTIVTWYRRSPAAATGFAQTGLSLGAGLGPLGFGIMAEQRGYPAAWGSAGVVSLLACLTILGARRHLRARRREHRIRSEHMEDLHQGQFETPAVSDAMDNLGLESGVVTGLTRVAGARPRVVGRARTATVVDSDAPDIPGLAEYLDEAGKGDLLVLGWEATSEASVWGGLAATRSVTAGCVGMVNAGWVRDVDEVRQTPLTVWCLGALPRSGKGRLAVERIGEPTTVSDVVVHDRDLVVADTTGVCVVPAARAREVLAAAENLQARDVLFRRALATGAGFRSARARAGTM